MEAREIKKDVLVAVITKKQGTEKEGNVRIFQGKDGSDIGVSISCMLRDKGKDGNTVFAEIIDFSPVTIQKAKEGRYKAFDTVYALGKFEESEWNGEITHQFAADKENGLVKLDSIYLLKNKKIDFDKKNKTFVAFVGNLNQEKTRIARTATGTDMAFIHMDVVEKDGVLPVIVKTLDPKHIEWLRKALEDKKLNGCEYAVRGTLERDDNGNVSVWANPRFRTVQGKDGSNIEYGTFSIAHPIPAHIVEYSYPEHVVKDQDEKAVKKDGKSL